MFEDQPLNITTDNTMTVDGLHYYAQSRKCGKSTCKCATGEKLHGPYWYSRNIKTGAIKYIGKTLPQEIINLYEIRSDRKTRNQIEIRIKYLEMQIETLKKVLNGHSTDKTDERILDDIGFYNLVKQPNLV